MSRKINKLGRVYKRLLVLKEQSYKSNWGKIVYLCKCLGPHEPTYINVPSPNIGKQITSCGCLGRESQKGKVTKHGHWENGKPSRTWKTWDQMKQRCLNSNHHAFKLYGGRGISICSRWMIFENFLIDVGIRPEGMSLDRIDNDGNYEPENCRWTTPLIQVRNSRVAKLNEKNVSIIKRMLLEEYSKNFISKKFRVSWSWINHIDVGNSWKEIQSITKEEFHKWELHEKL